jgi:hypothetical protein
MLPENRATVVSRPAPRAFGLAEDLDLDFGHLDRPSLVTSVLARCNEPHDPEFWWNQPVGERIAALLRLHAVTEGTARLDLQSRCTDTACGQPFELELNLSAILDQSSHDDPLPVALDGERRVLLRRATGDDLRRWRAVEPQSRDEAVAVMIATLCVDGTASPDEATTLAAAIEAHDPLVAFTVACQCPACGVRQKQPIDLEAIVLSRLRVRQRDLVREVHTLASQYGWTESEVLAIAPSRRARYLELIEGGR